MWNKYRPKLHVTPNYGWLNDPNGFSYYQNKFHLFGQYYPYDTKWGPMHWIHFESEDLISWKEIGIALNPDQVYDKDYGCFSGSAIAFEQYHLLVYTGVANNKQTQCLAYSVDGVDYKKYNLNPIINEDLLPKQFDINNFRDPKIFYRHDNFYILIGAKRKDAISSLLLFKTKDFKDIKYVNSIFEMNNLKSGMLECCDIVFLNDTDDKCVLFCSPQYKKSSDKHHYQNIHSTIAIIGYLDFDVGTFVPSSPEIELDLGFDFYASQTMKKGDNIYLVAWEAMWDRNYPSYIDGYVGQYTMPRQLMIKDDNIFQHFVATLDKYFIRKYHLDNFLIDDELLFKMENKVQRIRFNIDGENDASIILFNKNGNGFNIFINIKDGIVLFDRSNSDEKIFNLDNSEANIRTIKIRKDISQLKFDILIDHCSCEVLIDNGRYAFTSQYFSENSYDICFKKKNHSFKINNLNIDVLDE